mmetsp:Transcript_38061/g.112721  ORF Transcript_38061/g.112721 Transcript_38061/m.112721 type:complete len:239 (+) Transcript_38061:158-874(+)
MHAILKACDFWVQKQPQHVFIALRRHPSKCFAAQSLYTRAMLLPCYVWVKQQPHDIYMAFLRRPPQRLAVQRVCMRAMLLTRDSRVQQQPHNICVALSCRDDRRNAVPCVHTGVVLLPGDSWVRKQPHHGLITQVRSQHQCFAALHIRVRSLLLNAGGCSSRCAMSARRMCTTPISSWLARPGMCQATRRIRSMRATSTKWSVAHDAKRVAFWRHGQPHQIVLAPPAANVLRCHELPV